MKKVILSILFFLTACIGTVEPPIPEPFSVPTPLSFAVTPQYKNVDILGLAKQNIRNIKKYLEPEIGIGVLEGTFGPVIPALKEVLSTGNQPSFRAHLANYTCIRNKNCSTGEIKINDIQKLTARAAAFEELHKAFPTVACYLSPWLEYDVTDHSLVNNWFNSVHAAAPSCTLVASAYKGWIPPNVLIERHGNSAKGNLISNDGESFFDANTDKYLEGGDEVDLAWWNRCNLRTSGEKVVIPPMKRTTQIQINELQQAQYLLTHSIQPVPSFKVCPRIRVLKSPEVWKTRSEDYNGKDVRENKSVLIVKGIFSNGFVIYSSAGKQIGCLKYYGSYSGLKGYYRYYIGNCSGQNPMQLLADASGGQQFIQSSPQEWVCLKNGNTQFAISAVRRSGTPR